MSNDPDPVAVMERTRDLAEQALAGLLDRMHHDRQFACAVERTGPSEFVGAVWRRASKGRSLKPRPQRTTAVRPNTESLSVKRSPLTDNGQHVHGAGRGQPAVSRETPAAGAGRTSAISLSGDPAEVGAASSASVLVSVPPRRRAGLVHPGAPGSGIVITPEQQAYELFTTDLAAYWGGRLR